MCVRVPYESAWGNVLEGFAKNPIARNDTGAEKLKSEPNRGRMWLCHSEKRDEIPGCRSKQCLGSWLGLCAANQGDKSPS